MSYLVNWSVNMTCFFLYWTYAVSLTVLSSTVVNSWVFSSQAVHLKVTLLLAVVSGNYEPSLNGLGIIYITTGGWVYKSQPLQPLSLPLSDPSYPRITTESRVCAGQFVRFSRFKNHRLRFSQCLTTGICKKKKKNVSKINLVLIVYYLWKKWTLPATDIAITTNTVKRFMFLSCSLSHIQCTPYGLYIQSTLLICVWRLPVWNGDG